MENITFLDPSKRQVLQGYGDMGFRVSGVRHEGSVLITASETVSWIVSGPEEITIEALEPILSLDTPPEILLLGCGETMILLPRKVRDAIREAGVALEAMDTGAAARTYNVLMAEDRSIMAALVAV